MRDLIIATLIIGSVPFIFSRPHIGILVWSIISYLNPHRFTWGFAYNFPFAQVIGLATMAALFFTKDRRKIPLSSITIFWFLFIFWICFTTVFSINSEYAVESLKVDLKIHLVALLTIVLIINRQHIDRLVWIIVLSLGFYGFKGGVFAFLTGSQYRVYGPPESFIEDNNALALALIMTLPLMWYLAQNMKILKKGKIKWMLVGAMLATLLAILTSHSRGALLALSTIAFFLWTKSRRKMATGMVILMVIPIMLAMMPSHWYERMATLKTYEQDKSAMGRITAWEFAIDIASKRFTGGGYDSFTDQNYYKYSPKVAEEVARRDGRFQGPHSIYFEVLGEHGWIGLALFLGLGFSAFLTGSWVIRNSRDKPHIEWTGRLAAMLQVSLVGYGISGAFLELASFDLFYQIVALMVILRILVEEYLKNPVVEEEDVVTRVDDNTPLPNRISNQ